MKDEWVTAIITTCRREPEIVRRALMSVVSQTYPNIEIIIVDDSPDSFEQRDQVRAMAEEVSKNTEKPIRYIRQPECRGACAARNTGIELSTGKYIAFLDDDDEWLPRKTEVQLSKMTSDDIALVYCDNEKYYDKSGRTLEVIRPKHTEKVYERMFITNFIGSTSFPLIRKSALQEIGGFDEKMQSAQDADVWIRLASRYKVAYADEILVRYHVHSGARISTNAEKKIKGLERIIEKNMDYLKHDRVAFWTRHMAIIPYYMKNGDTSKAWKTWFTGMIRCPQKVRGNLRNLKKILTMRPKN